MVTVFHIIAGGADSTMYRKQKGLLRDGENLSKIYIIEKRVVIACSRSREKKVIKK
jgi:hypothetical protein